LSDVHRNLQDNCLFLLKHALDCCTLKNPVCANRPCWIVSPHIDPDALAPSKKDQKVRIDDAVAARDRPIAAIRKKAFNVSMLIQKIEPSLGAHCLLSLLICTKSPRTPYLAIRRRVNIAGKPIHPL